MKNPTEALLSSSIKSDAPAQGGISGLLGDLKSKMGAKMADLTDKDKNFYYLEVEFNQVIPESQHKMIPAAMMHNVARDQDRETYHFLKCVTHSGEIAFGKIWSTKTK